jgi:hypothetical protein
VENLEEALAEAGGAAAEASTTAELRRGLDLALAHGRAELEKPRSGYGAPVEIAVASTDDGLRAVVPVDASFRADPAGASERVLLLVGAVVAALVDLAGEPPRPPVSAGDLLVRVGDRGGGLVIAHPAVPLDPAELEEFLPLAFDDRAARIDRLRSRALAVPAALLADGGQGLRSPIGSGHPIKIAEAVARLGGEPSDPRSVDEHEEAVLALLTAGIPDATRPHEDPDPARRVARRILQRLDGMGKWGGYHTDFAHLARGFAGNERALAQDVGEALIAAGLLDEKPSVGQRHVFLNPRRAADVHALIERGEAPPELKLPG